MSTSPPVQSAIEALTPADHETPMRVLKRWIADADTAGVRNAAAMTLATCDAQGVPSARVVICRGVTDDTLTFFTDHRSRKGMQLAENPHASCVFYWRALDRQVRVSGRVAKAPADVSDAYHAKRIRASQIQEHASVQSAPLESRDVLVARIRDEAMRFANADVPRPEWWGGYHLTATRVELWCSGSASRLHERIEWTREAPGAPWAAQMLFP